MSWADNRISALEAFAAATTQLTSNLANLAAAHNRRGYQPLLDPFSTLELWNALISVSTLEGLEAKLGKEPVKSMYKDCQVVYNNATASFRAALLKLPKLGPASSTQ